MNGLASPGLNGANRGAAGFNDYRSWQVLHCHRKVIAWGVCNYLDQMRVESSWCWSAWRKTTLCRIFSCTSTPFNRIFTHASINLSYESCLSIPHRQARIPALTRQGATRGKAKKNKGKTPVASAAQTSPHRPVRKLRSEAPFGSSVPFGTHGRGAWRVGEATDVGLEALKSQQQRFWILKGRAPHRTENWFGKDSKAEVGRCFAEVVPTRW